MSIRSLAAGLALILTTALGVEAQGPPQTAPLERANLDTSCAACADFYSYANGGWLKHTSIPASYPAYGSFNELADRNEAVLHDILTVSAERARTGQSAPGSGAWKVGTFYATCMDSVAIQRRGLASLAPDLARVDRIHSQGDLVGALASLERRTGVAPWRDGATIDSRDAGNTIAGLYQGGLTLPTSEYYTKTDSGSIAMRARYRAHVARMFRLLGDSPGRAADNASAVLAVETRLARASRTPVQLRDVVANYHRVTRVQADSVTPHLDWERFYRALGAPVPQRIDMGQPAFFAAVDSMLVGDPARGGVPVAAWKAYLRWRIVHAAAPALPVAFEREHFAFERLFSGATEMLPRWKRCVGATDGALGEELGREYVARTFSPEAKTRAVRIVDNLVRELRARIEQLPWMGAATRAEALVKLDAFTRKIGYPDHWRDYSTMTIGTTDYLTNLRAARQFETARDWAKIGRPTDRTEWGMTPPTVNAYENPLLNEIVFPAGILQPPFYDPKADDALNYGAMGAVIGHEMSHAFDDQGRQYDKTGNLRDWWTPDDAARYDAEALKIVRQFDAYTVLDSATHVQGRLTLGENIGDFGGLTVAYAAMKRALAQHPQPTIDGFTPEQRFFLGWAQVWRELDRPEYLRYLVNSNEHSPSKWRVNGPLSNMPEFRAAWGCREGDPMVRPDALRPHIW
jgi:putative endopeptidase